MRLYTAAALVGVEGPRHGVPVLLELLYNPDAALRAEAVGMLAEIAPSELDVLPELARALEDDDPGVRVAAADAFGHVGPPARSFISALGALLRDPHESVRDRMAAERRSRVLPNVAPSPAERRPRVPPNVAPGPAEDRLSSAAPLGPISCRAAEKEL